MKHYAKRKRLLAITSIVALATVAVFAVAWSVRSTHADVDCSGPWWNSTDPTVFSTCLAQQGPHDNSDPVIEEATAAALPGTPIEPDFTPMPILPEPDDFAMVYSIPYTPELSDPIPPILSGVTSFWRDGGVPADDYMSWNMLFVVSRPGNGASYKAVGTNPLATVTIPATSNPTIETLTGSLGGALPKYEKAWTDPQADGALYITNITNPAYTNTDPNIPYPGLRSMVYFTTKSGQTGHFDMSTETWTFDPTRGIVDTPTAPPSYP